MKKGIIRIDFFGDCKNYSLEGDWRGYQIQIVYNRVCEMLYIRNQQEFDLFNSTSKCRKTANMKFDDLLKIGKMKALIPKK